MFNGIVPFCFLLGILAFVFLQVEVDDLGLHIYNRNNSFYN